MKYKQINEFGKVVEVEYNFNQLQKDKKEEIKQNITDKEEVIEKKKAGRPAKNKE